MSDEEPTLDYHAEMRAAEARNRARRANDDKLRAARVPALEPRKRFGGDVNLRRTKRRDSLDDEFIAPDDLSRNPKRRR